jgi:hypothetical protein
MRQTKKLEKEIKKCQRYEDVSYFQINLCIQFFQIDMFENIFVNINKAI